ncbi:MAG TPA: hypothetical protein PKY53_07165 [Clostridia bacterium]|nr:hypothetical protein [Clostridia bacterium]
MKTALKKYIPQVIGLLLIVGIVITVYFAFFAEKPAVYIPDNNLIDTSYKDEEQKTSYIRSIPKQSQSSETFLYYQSITGDGNTFFKNIFKTASGNYIVCESDCKNGDIQGEKRCVGIARLDDLANISQVYTIPSQQSSYYVNAQITPEGIVVITTNAAKEVYYVNIVSYELDSVHTIIIQYADECIIRPDSNSFIIISEFPDENYIYRYSDGKLAFTGITAGNVVEVFEFSKHYTLFINTANGYTIANVNKSTLNVTGETYINGYTLVSVNPIIEDGVQKFLTIETNGSAYARKMTRLDNSESSLVKLGTFSVKDVCRGDSLVLVCSGRHNGLVYLSYDLVCAYGESGTNYWVTSVVDSNYLNGTYYYLTLNAENELVLLTRKNDTTTSIKIAANCQGGSFIFNANNSIMIAYQTVVNNAKCIEIIGII